MFSHHALTLSSPRINWLVAEARAHTHRPPATHHLPATWHPSHTDALFATLSLDARMHPRDVPSSLRQRRFAECDSVSPRFSTDSPAREASPTIPAVPWPPGHGVHERFPPPSGQYRPYYEYPNAWITTQGVEDSHRLCRPPRLGNPPDYVTANDGRSPGRHPCRHARGASRRLGR